MDKNERALQRATRRTPAPERDRYEEEWRGDLDAAALNGLDPRQVARGARTMSRRRRLRYLKRVLLGAKGLMRAVIAWLILLLVVLLLLVPLVPVLLVAVVLLMLSSAAGVHSRFSYWLMVSSLGAGVLSFVFAVWSWNVAFDAADNFQEAPAFTNWMGEALLLTLLCAGVFIGTVVSAMRRESSLKAPSSDGAGAAQPC